MVILHSEISGILRVGFHGKSPTVHQFTTTARGVPANTKSEGTRNKVSSAHDLPQHDDAGIDIEYLHASGQFDQWRRPVGMTANDERT